MNFNISIKKTIRSALCILHGTKQNINKLKMKIDELENKKISQNL